MYKVLLVDDEYMILEGLKRLVDWQSYGFEVVGTAENAQEALAYIGRNTIDLVITDVNMPGMTGIELIEAAQEQKHHFRFLILSGYQEFEYVKAGLRLGAENYLLKPIDKKELVLTLEKVATDIKREEEKSKSDVLLFEHLLQRWVTDDIDYGELKRVMAQFSYELTTSFSVLVFEMKTDILSLLEELLQRFDQHFYYVTPDTHYFIVIFNGPSNDLQRFIESAQQNLPNEGWFLGIGELVELVSEVYQSFNHAFYAVGLNAFYHAVDVSGDHSMLAKDVNVSYLPHFTFDNFSKALLIRNFTTIKTEINLILSQLRQEGVQPNYVRHIVFLLFMDIYRQFETLDEVFYQRHAQLISEADHFDELAAVILSALEETKNSRSSRRYSQNVAATLKLIHEHYGENLNLKQVSDQLFLNVMYLGQLFKKETQKSFSQYLNHYRIKQAQNLLVHSTLNVNEIADKVGYTSSGYFYKNFKKICGLSPSDFRDEFLHNYEPVDG